MLASIAAIPAGAVEDSYTGYSAARVEKIDTSKMTDINDYETYPSKTEYKIADAKGLKKVAELVNEGTTKFAGVTLYLANNIDLGYAGSTAANSDRWTPIGISETDKYFSGTFDGQGHTINRLFVRMSVGNTSDSVTGWGKESCQSIYGNINYTPCGFIGAGRACTVRNLIIGPDSNLGVSGNYFGNNTRAGAIIGTANANTNGDVTTVDNCYNAASVWCSQKSGGIVGYWYAGSGKSDSKLVISNCTNAGSVSGSEAGGMIGESASILEITNCRNLGAVYTANAGGMAGRVRGADVTVTGCINNGAVGTASSSNVGAMISKVDTPAANTASVTNCTNYGSLTVKSGGNCNGIYGVNANSALSESGNQNLAGQVDSTLDATDIIRPTVNTTTVSSTLMFHGTQESAVTSGKYSVRFVGSIDSTNYEKVGMNVTAVWDGGNSAHVYSKDASVVFSTLVEGTDAGLKRVDAAQLRGRAGYLYAFTINDIPASAGKITFTVTPYTVSADDGAITNGTSYDVVYNAGSFVSIEESAGAFVLPDAVAKKMTILVSSAADQKITKIAELLQADMLKALGTKPAIVTVASGASTAGYANAIVIGDAGSEAAALKSELTALASYTTKVELGNEGVKVYLVGATDLSTIRAVQYFYRSAVVNGDFKIPKYLDETVTSLYERDPGLLYHDGVYYYYVNYGGGYGVRTSTDLINWSSVKQVWKKTTDNPELDADSQYWAPEGHYYNGKFYIFATYGVSSYEDTGTSQRGCVVLVSDTPDGKFTMISKASANAAEVGWITPNTMSAIDGHLWVDENGQPYLVFVREWTHTEDGVGRVSYAPLSDDLSYLTGDWKDMIKASDPSWTDYKITDGPYMYKATGGDLFMIWSNKDDSGNYTVGLAKSSNGKISGTWTHLDPLFIYDGENVYTQTDGGHGCIFAGTDGRIYLAIHTVNDQAKWVQSDDEWPDGTGMTALTLIPIVESGGTLKLDLVQ